MKQFFKNSKIFKIFFRKIRKIIILIFKNLKMNETIFFNSEFNFKNFLN